MPSNYDPHDHIHHLDVAPRSENVLDQREITIQSYKTNVPFNLKAVSAGLNRGWLDPAVRFGVFAPANDKSSSHLTVILGLQDELSVRAYDYDERRPIWFAWKDVIIDTMSVRYSRDENGLLRLTTTGGGRRITDDMLYEFNSRFIGIPKAAVSKMHFDFAKLRELCFNRFFDHLYMLKFTGPSGKEYESIDHTQFKSRQYIDPEAPMLQGLRRDEHVKIESFDSDIIIRHEALSEKPKIRFDIRGTSGALHMRFPKLSYASQLATPEEQAKVFYEIVEVAASFILDADYYEDNAHSLEDLDADLGMFPDLVDLTEFRQVLKAPKQLRKFLFDMNLNARWDNWQPYLRAINELIASNVINEHVMTIVTDLSKQKPLTVAALLEKCRSDGRMNTLGNVVAPILAELLYELPAENRAQIEEGILSWAIDHESQAWDIHPASGEIRLFALRWKKEDLSPKALMSVIWKLVGVIHERLVSANGNTGELLDKYQWCLTAAKSLPSMQFAQLPGLRLVAEGRVPYTVADGEKVVKSAVPDLPTLDNLLRDHFHLPLWPRFLACRSDGKIVLHNTGQGIAFSVKAAESGSLFAEGPLVDLLPGENVELDFTKKVKAIDVCFTKYDKEYRHGLNVEAGGVTNDESNSSTEMGKGITLLAAALCFCRLEDPENSTESDNKDRAISLKNRWRKHSELPPAIGKGPNRAKLFAPGPLARFIATDVKNVVTAKTLEAALRDI